MTEYIKIKPNIIPLVPKLISFYNSYNCIKSAFGRVCHNYWYRLNHQNLLDCWH